MPGSADAQAATAPPSPGGAATYGGPPVVKVISRDMAGHVIEPAPQTRVDAGCSRATARTNAPGTQLCAPHPIPDPTSFGAIGIALICGILIIGGALTFTERGPGKLIKPKPRRRGATQRARLWRRRIGAALVLVGFIGLVRAFV